MLVCCGHHWHCGCCCSWHAQLISQQLALELDHRLCKVLLALYQPQLTRLAHLWAECTCLWSYCGRMNVQHGHLTSRLSTPYRSHEAQCQQHNMASIPVTHCDANASRNAGHMGLYPGSG